MVPLNQGMFDFNKDSIVELRKRIGITQSKMAEMLGVPANTLSRWETGVTAPDANVLAVLYSIAKQNGLDLPSFFIMRPSPLSLKMSSEAPTQAADALPFFEALQGYLKTQIELNGTEMNPVINILISNTAPQEPSWPKIVFMGVGLSLAYAGTNINPILPQDIKTSLPGQKQVELKRNPWESKLQDSGTNFRRVDKQEFPGFTQNENQHGIILSPGESIIYEIDVRPELLPYLRFRVEGTVSRRHLFHSEQVFTMPLTFARPLVVRALIDFNPIDLNSPLDDVIGSLPKFDNETRLAEVQAFTRVLSDSVEKIAASREKLSSVFREQKLLKVRAHLIDAFVYLDRAKDVFTRMKEAIDSNVSERLVAGASAIMSLKDEKVQIDQKTRELMQEFAIDAEELRIVNK